MKKYFLSIAVLFLAIALNAFTGPNKVHKLTNDTYLYWYYYDPYFNELTGQIGTMPKIHAEAVYATGCSDYYLATYECARGYETAQDPYEEDPGVGVDRVRDDWD